MGNYYRVIRRVGPTETTVAIHGVFYDKDGQIARVSPDPEYPCGVFDIAGLNGLRKRLAEYVAALDEPALTYDYATLEAWRVPSRE